MTEIHSTTPTTVAKREVIHCERCGVEDTPDPFDGTAHSPLCQGETGQFTHLSGDQVRDTLQMIDRCDGQVVRKPFPLDPDGFNEPF